MNKTFNSLLFFYMNGPVTLIFYTNDVLLFCAYLHLGILNRYASSFYGPFREALDSNPRFGDKKTYVVYYIIMN